MANHFIVKSTLTAIVWAAVIYGIWQLVGFWPSAEAWREALSASRFWGPLGFALAFLVASVVRTYRWGLLIRPFVTLSWRHVFFGYSWCFLLNAVMPFRIGELSRPVWVKQQGGSFSKSAGALIVERINDFIVLLGLLFVVTLDSRFPGWLNWFGMAALLALLLVYSAALGFAVPAGRYLSVGKWRNSLSGKYLVYAADALGSIIGAFANRRLNGICLALSIIIWSIMAIGVNMLLASQLGLEQATLSASVAVLALVNLSTLLPTLPGNLGLFEVTAVYALVIFSVPESAGIPAAVIYHFMILAMAFLCGAVGWIGLRCGVREKSSA